MTTALPTTPAPATPPATAETVADLIAQLGGISPKRIRIRPLPGTASEQDVLDAFRKEHRLFELIDSVLVEKAMGFRESLLAAVIIEVLRAFVAPRKLGLVTSSDGMMRIAGRQVRIPDAAFISWARIPGGRTPTEAIPNLVPDVAVEVTSESNTVEELRRKREEYLQNGCRFVWQIDPDARTVEVYSEPEGKIVLREQDTLTGGDVLPGFALPLRNLFAVLDEEAPR